MCTSCIHGRDPEKSQEAPWGAQNSELNAVSAGMGARWGMGVGLSEESK